MDNFLVKQDINFLEHPLWFQADNLERSEEGHSVWKDRAGFLYTAGYKAPVRIDGIFLLALLRRSQRQSWSSKLSFSRYEILKECGLCTKGPYWYDRFMDSLKRWKMVGIEFDGTFYNGNEHISANFGIIDAWIFNKKTKVLEVHFSEHWLAYIEESKFFKILDFESIKKLHSPTAMRLYEILVKTFHGRESWQIDALKLANKIPLKEKHPAHIVPKIQTAVKRISEKTDLQVDMEVDKSERGKAMLTFQKVSRSKLSEEYDDSIEDIEPLFGSVLSLLPEKERKKKTILSMLQSALRERGFEYVKRNVLYTNHSAKKNYRIYLEKSLQGDWGHLWWEEKIQEESDKKDRETSKKEELSILPEHFATREETELWLEKRLKEEGKLNFIQHIREKIDKGYAGDSKTIGYSKDYLEYSIQELPSFSAYPS